MALRLVLLLAVLTVIDLSVGTVTSLNRQKRSDDTDPLGVVVEQMAQQILSLKQQVEVFKSETNAKIATLQTRAASLGKTVAFYAGNNNDTIPTAPYGTVILDTAFTNVGNGYDTSTGVFTAPVSGLYDLQAVFMLKEFSGKDIYAKIQVDGRQVAGGVADDRNGAWDQTSIRAIVHVTADQKVVFSNASGVTVNFYGHEFTRFSGLLIKSD